MDQIRNSAASTPAEPDHRQLLCSALENISPTAVGGMHDTLEEAQNCRSHILFVTLASTLDTHGGSDPVRYTAAAAAGQQ